jgi:hypothetical protein
VLVHGAILVPTVAFYAIYRELDPSLTKFLRLQAQKNAVIALGLDIQVFSSSTHRSVNLRSIASFFIESLRHFLWYLSETSRGHVILPIPAIVTLIYALRRVLLPQSIPRLPGTTAVDLYRLGWPEQDLAPELMATYLRFIALENELYGLRPYDNRYIRLCVFTQIYSSIVSSLFQALPPTAYISIYSGYIQHFIPCLHASKIGSPILILGCSDCLYRIDDSAVPRQFLHLTGTLKDPESYEQIVTQGQIILQQRLGGSLDSAIEYMHSSPFISTVPDVFWAFPSVVKSLYEYSPLQTAESRESSGKFIVVFMHELQDWHHNGVLPPYASSYYEWLFITVKCLIDHELPFVIKIHPAIVAQPSKYRQTIHAVCNMSSILHVKLPISSASTTLALIDMGMGLGLTVRGTIGLELAYLRVPFICAGTPPYGSLFPRRTELDVDGYFSRLRHFKDEPKVSLEESAAASYYVGLQDKMINCPDIHLHKKVLHTSSEAEFIQAKRML